MLKSNKTGQWEMQVEGYRAFIPSPLSSSPEIKYDDELQSLLSSADRALAKLDGIATVLPNPELFIAMYVKREALLSSQIEGTQASLEGVLEFESDITPRDDVNEIIEVVQYIKALNYGLERLETLPMSLRLIREIHRTLLEKTRGKNKSPGEFRQSQNWIGVAGATLNNATFVPPPPQRVLECMGDLEKFLHEQDGIPPLIKIALIHSQFESIHPFLDGNGRVGQLLITLYLMWKEILGKPLLYLSYYLKRNRQEYEHLLKVRTDGAWEPWLKFFLRGVCEISVEAATTAREIIQLKERTITKLYENDLSSIYAVRLIDQLFLTPLITTNMAQDKLGAKKLKSLELIKDFERIGILQETTGKQRYKKFQFTEYLSIIAKGTEIVN